MKTAGMWVPIVLCGTMIFVISQNTQITELFPWIPSHTKEMVGHLGLYFILGFLLARYLFGMGVGGFTALVFTVNLTVVLGFYDEFHQSFVGDRSVQLYDIMLDLAGGTAGGLAYLAWAAVRWLAVKSARSREVRLDLLVRHAAVALTLFVFLLVPAAVCSVLIKDYVRALALDGPVAAQRVLDRFLQPERPIPVPDRSTGTPTRPAVPQYSAGPVLSGQSAHAVASSQSLRQFALVAELLSRTKRKVFESPVSPASAPGGTECGRASEATEALGSSQ